VRGSVRRSGWTGSLRRSVFAALGLVLALAVPGAAAMDVAVLLSETEGRSREFMDALDGALRPGKHRLSAAGVASATPAAEMLARAELVLAVGLPAAERALRDSTRPVLAVLVGERDIARLRQAHPGRGLGAVVLDQPLERYMRLVRAVLPDAQRVGVLLGPDSRVLINGLVPAAGAVRLQLGVQQVSALSELVPALDTLLFEGGALLPLPDSFVSGPAAARTILLTSYRHRSPVFAHSAAYVTAGALAAVFSTPEHIAADVAELLGSATDPAAVVRKVRHPRRFGVAVNRAVARALGLVVADEQVLRERVAQGASE
jgi:ABC-type uncharacterized transport system substrate-binding protein